MTPPRSLPIPPAAADDPRAVELARVWAARGGQHVSLAALIWEDPAAWGVMLVDLARHVANAYHQSTGAGIDETLSRIRAGFDAEWDYPTDQPSGTLTG